MSKPAKTRIDVVNMLKLVEEFNLTPEGWVVNDYSLMTNNVK